MQCNGFYLQDVFTADYTEYRLMAWSSTDGLSTTFAAKPPSTSFKSCLLFSLNQSHIFTESFPREQQLASLSLEQNRGTWSRLHWHRITPFFLNHDFRNSSHTSFLWSTLDDGTGQVNCWSTTEDAADAAKGFPALGIPHCWAAHTTPYWVYTLTRIRTPLLRCSSHTYNSSSILGSCHFQTFVSEQQLLLARKN